MVSRYSFFFILFLLSACTGSKNEESPEENLDVPEVNPITVSRITFTVPNFESWFDLYMEEQPFRQKADLETMGIFVDSKVDNSYHIFLRATSASSLKDYFDSKSYYNSFSIPSNEIVAREIIDVTQLAEKTFDQDYRLLISHKIKDYPEWKSIFNSDAANRDSHGLETVGIGRSIDDPSQIYVMFAFDDEEKVKRYIDGDEFRTNLQEAGVVGPLKVTQVAPIKGIAY